MKVAHARLKSLSPYSQSRMVFEKKPDKLDWDAWEAKTWRDKAHLTPEGNLYIPPMQFKRALETAAQMLSLKIKGRGTATYTKHFLAGVQVLEPLVLPLTRDQLVSETINANADGKRGSGKRVLRTFPIVHQWEGVVTYHVFDDTITEDVFEKVLRESGNFVGIGRFRAAVGGMYGRYAVVEVSWEKEG